MTFSSHHGHILRSRSSGDFTLTEVAYATQTTLRRHAHQLGCLSFVLHGSYTESYAGRRFDCRTSQLLYRPAGEEHSDDFSEPGTRCLLMEFAPRRFESVAALREPARFEGDDLRWLTSRLRQETRDADDFIALSIEALMLELIVTIGRKCVAAAGDARWMRQVKELIHSWVAEPISLSQLAHQIGVHPVYLSAAFHKHSGFTVGEYVRRVRVEHASRQLAETDIPLVSVGLAAGFSDQAHFSRTFKRVTGLTPTQFRAASRRRT